METVIAKLRGDLWKYVNGSTESFVLVEILIGIVVLQYTFRMEPISIIEIITSVVSGLYLADLGTGLIHLYFDVFDNSLLKPVLSEFSTHHTNPQDILDWSLWKALKETSVVPIPLICVLYNLTPLTSKSQMLCQIITLYGMHISQIIHKYAHLTNYLTDEDKQKPEYKLMMFLQDNHLILHPRDHHIHHTGKHDVNFCIVNGWANPLLNSIVHIPFIHSRLFPEKI
jgi:ubiquitin-conjugating enzyme E2 variant